MNSEKRVFSILGGIFLMAASTFMFLSTAGNLITAFRYIGNYSSYAVSINLEIALLLCGLFLLLRKKLLAAIMICVAALFYLVGVASTMRSGVAVNAKYIFYSVCYFLAYGLCGAGLFGKGVYGLIMCGSAALLRFIPFVNQLQNLSKNIGYGGLSALMRNTGSLLGSILSIAGMVMAGLYLFSLREQTEQPEYPYQY